MSPLARDMTQEALIDVCRSQSDEANRCTLMYSSVMFFSFVVPANLPRTKFIIGNLIFFLKLVYLEKQVASGDTIFHWINF